ncbi:MAG: stage V sporulation protein AD [Velocimicrobium sp.]
MNNKQFGRQSILFGEPPYIIEESSIAGKKEGEGPLGGYFDEVEEDPMCGGNTWEEAESRLQSRVIARLLKKANLEAIDIRYLLGGDLLGQLIATSFGIETFEIPLFGLYGACSTMGESISLGSMLIAGGYADKVIAITSSHFASAEKQFRFPLGYGNQRPLAATYTVTGSGAIVLSKQAGERKKGQKVCVTGITTGRIIDYGVKDSMNMGACMAPAAADLIYNHLKDFSRIPAYYDKIITGDLGYIGQEILLDILQEKGYDITENHMDCGIEIYDTQEQDTHAGGSGCGCSAITLTSFILRKMRKEEWKKVLFVPTGALLSTVSFNEGNTVPSIAHGVVLEVV